MIRATITVSKRVFEQRDFWKVIRTKTFPSIISTLRRKTKAPLSADDFKTIVSPEGDKMKITFYENKN